MKVSCKVQCTGKNGKSRDSTPPNENVSRNDTRTVSESDGLRWHRTDMRKRSRHPISSAIGSDYGHWSDTLRKAFDHDRVAYNRRTDREYREVKKTYLSVLISGTPSQVKSLIPTAENGLFSRQIFYYMPSIRQWQKPVRPERTRILENVTESSEQRTIAVFNSLCDPIAMTKCDVEFELG